MEGNLCSLSPGLILSGLYPAKKSVLNFSPDLLSKIGTQNSSVAPGYTVDSYTTISRFFKILPIISDADLRGLRSGWFDSSSGVGTVTIKTLQSCNSDIEEVNDNLFAALNSDPSISNVESIPLVNSSILDCFKSKPTTSNFLPNSTARGNPT